ncbi:MAG TPA: MOSC N-terminal beta barrel domain-containing protein [Nitrospira sp.]|nr:MOSC N-terminal beta barrel domain-containing protein [Nitrospira sp.]
MTAKLGKVASLWRYPVKSMEGEELSECEVTQHGLLGDRVYALIDVAEGKAASAKNPVKWPTLLACKAHFAEPPKKGTAPPVVRIALHDGTATDSTGRDCHRILSKALKRTVILAVADRGWMSGVHATLPATWAGRAEQYWPDIDGLDHREAVTDFTLPRGTFFDGATIHLVTLATLIKLHEFYPKGRFEPQRFRPNILVDTPATSNGFVEQGWIGKTIKVGDIRLAVTGPCGRCVMTTLAQKDLPKDNGILRTAVQRNEGNVGVYAKVIQGGTIKRGDCLTGWG